MLSYPQSRHMASDITGLLLAWTQGDSQALEQLMPLVYQELHRIAARHFRGERSQHTLQTTALVHEAYLRLVNQHRARWENRAQFFAVAAQLMRRILVDQARAERAAKRGAGLTSLTLTAAQAVAAGEPGLLDEVDVLALDGALDRLSRLDERQARIVELRFFSGLDLEETAAVVGVSGTTVKREWSMAKAWLYRELRGAP